MQVIVNTDHNLAAGWPVAEPNDLKQFTFKRHRRLGNARRTHPRTR